VLKYYRFWLVYAKINIMHYIRNYQEYLNQWEIIRQELPIYVTYEAVRCKHCCSKNIIRYGTTKNIQVWWCKDCRRKFSHSDTLPHMKAPAIQVALTLGMYWQGMSIDAIRHILYKMYNNYPSRSTIYEWINRISRRSMHEAKDYHPEVGDIWIAKEIAVRIKGKKYHIVDVVDPDTRFILATKLSCDHKINDIRHLMESASNRAKKAPKRVVTNGRKGYQAGIELAYGADCKHIQFKAFSKKVYTEFKTWWHSMLRNRTIVMRGLRDEERAQFLQESWLIYYNYFRPQDALAGKTPAEKAGIEFIPSRIP
jgi:transposase-like protein